MDEVDELPGLPEVIPDWVRAEWPLPAEPAWCSCIEPEPATAPVEESAGWVIPGVTWGAALIEGAPGARPAVADSGSPVPREVLRRWWCDSRVTAFVLSKGGQALRAVHLGRTLSAVERRAASIEDGGRCAGIGCCRSGTDPTVDLRPHHVRRYADDGVTSLTDTVLVCDTLHRDLHEGGRTVRLRHGRQLNEAGWVQ